MSNLHLLPSSRSGGGRFGPFVATVLVAASFLLPISSAHASEQARLGSDAARTSGTVLVAAGATVQALGVGLSIWNLATIGNPEASAPPFWLRPVAAGVSVPFAPLTVGGYERLLSDGTPLSRVHALGTGFLQGAAYSGLQAGLGAISIAVWEDRCRSRRQEWDGFGVSPCFEDFSNIGEFAILLPHAMTAVGFLVPGIILRSRTAVGASEPDPSRAPMLSPVMVRGGGGLRLSGVF